MKQTCILVLGMHRSGTSALTGVLSFLDIYLASIIGGDKNNEKGYFENWKIQQLSDKLLTSIDSSWDDAFFNLEKLEALEKNSAELKDIVASEFKYSRLFAIKDPRACLLYPIFERSLNELDVDVKVIIPYRNPLEVAYSLRARDQISLEKGMLLWAYHFLLAEKFSRGRERIFVSFDELVKNTSNVVIDISKKLTLDLEKKYAENSKKIADFLKPNLKHHNISMDNFSSSLPKIISDILRLKNKFNSTDLSEDFDRLRSELFNYQRLFYNKNITVSLDKLGRTRKLLQDKDVDLGIAKQGMQDEKTKLADIQLSLQTKESELNQALQGLQDKDIELNLAKQGMQDEKTKFADIQLSLQKKESELNQALQGLQDKDIELNLAKQGMQYEKTKFSDIQLRLQKKASELNQTLQSLQDKNAELNRTKQVMQKKDSELSLARKVLQDKEDQIMQIEQSFKVKEQELNSTRQELLGIYKSRSWRITRFLRTLRRKLNK